MRVIIAGGSGLIGTALAEKLLTEGHQVSILSRGPSRKRLPTRAQAARWDGRTPDGWQHLVEEADAIVNLVGENLGKSKWTPARKALILNSRTMAGQAITAAVQAANHKPGVLLQASAVGYYGTTDDKKLDENQPPGDDFMAQVCVQWEDSTRLVEELGVRRIVIRSGVVLAAGSDILNKFLLQFHLFGGGPLGSGKQWLPWIHITDQIDAMLFLIKNELADGAYNLMSPEPATNAQFGKTLGKLIRRPYWIPVPAFALKLVLGEMSNLVLDGQRAIPRRLLEAGYNFRFVDLELALRSLLSKKS